MTWIDCLECFESALLASAEKSYSDSEFESIESAHRVLGSGGLRSKIETKIDWYCSRGSSCCDSWARELVPYYSKVHVRYFAVALVLMELVELSRRGICLELVVAELVVHEAAQVSMGALSSRSALWLHFVAASDQLEAHFVVAAALALDCEST